MSLHSLTINQVMPSFKCVSGAVILFSELCLGNKYSTVENLGRANENEVLYCQNSDRENND